MRKENCKCPSNAASALFLPALANGLKNRSSVFCVSIIFIVFSSVFMVSAEGFTGQVKQVLSETGDSLGGVLTPLFGDKEMLTRVFFFILLYMIFYSLITSLFKGRKFLSHGVSLIVAILSIMALPPNFIIAIRGTYGAMGAAVLTAIPFGIMLFYTARVDNALLARIGWIFFSVYYLSFYLYQIFADEAGWLSAEIIPYFFGFVGGIAVFFFISQIRNALFKGEIEALEESGHRIAERAKALHKIQKEELEGYTGGSGI